MDDRTCRQMRRRAFWIGFWSALDLSGRRTDRAWRQWMADYRRITGMRITDSISGDAAEAERLRNARAESRAGHRTPWRNTEERA